jgi:hypothetical protein
MTNKSIFLNGGRFEMEGSFDLSATATVLNLIQPDGSTKTCRGQFMSCVKSTTGTYVVTVKLASSLDGQPVFQPVELLDAHADLVGATVATALDARVSSVAKDQNGNIAITVLTTGSTGAAVDTTAAVTVSFRVVIEKNRMGGVL